MRDRRPFWEKVKRGEPDECWPWTGFVRPSGHGLTSHKSTPVNASRKAWILTNGEIRGGLCVNHRCDNALCCNPAHMYLGTRADNMMDLWLKTAANERGPMGRTRVLTDTQLQALWIMRKETKPAVTLKECARIFNVHLGTICRYITEYRLAMLARNRLAKLSKLAN